MRDVLSNVLSERDDAHVSDRILAAAFFRRRPLQAGSSPASIVTSVGVTGVTSAARATHANNVVVLAERRESGAGFVVGGGKRR